MILISIPCMVFAQHTASISGTITDSAGTPVANACINVSTATPPDWDQVTGTCCSDADGNYTAHEIPAGQDVYVMTHASCQDENLNLMDEWYAGENTSTPDQYQAQPVNVTAGETQSEVNFQLDQGGTISGTVLDDQGQPIANLHVNADLYDQDGNWLFGTGNSTSADGKYTITGLPEGDYKVRAEGQNLGYVQEYYNDTHDWDQAELVHVEPGVTSPEGIDFTLEMGATITGTIFRSDGQQAGEGVEIIALQGDPCGQQDHYAWAHTDSNGDYTLKGVPAGDIYLKTDNNNQSNYLNEWWNETESSWDCQDAQSLSVSQNDVIKGKDFQLDAGASISGTVYENDGVTPIQGLHVYVTPEACTGAWGIGRETDESGNYTIPGIPGDAVYVRACPNCSGHDYIDKWYDGDGGSGTNDCGLAVDVPVTSGQVINIDFEMDYDIPFELIYTHNADGSFTQLYYLEFWPFNTFSPDSVVSISLTDPSGSVIKSYTRQQGVEGYGDFVYLEQWKAFEAKSLNITPELGVYTFTVVTDTFTAVVQKEKTLNREIPVPDISQMLPVSDTIVTSKTPVFSWGEIHFEGIPLFYRVTIYDETGYRVFSSGREQDLFSIAIPKSVLTPGATYSWKVDVYDNGDGRMSVNRATSEYVNFTVADSPEHVNSPAIDIDGWGAVAYHTTDYDATSGWIEVIDHDGLAYDGSSHQVSVTYDGATHPLNFVRSDSPTSGYYELWQNEPAPAGDYRFSVTDPDGNTSTLTDTLVVDVLPSPDENSFVLNANGTTPTFTWDAVPGATRYRVRIYNSDGSTVWKGYPQTLQSPSYTVPPGALQPNTDYNYRIEAWDAHSGLDIDNVSKSPASNSNNPTFQTGNETEAPFVEIHSGAETWDESFAGPFLSFWLKIYDAQGVPGNIKSVKATFPDSSEIPLYLDYTESSTCGIYRNNYFVLTVEEGVYTITVEDFDGHITRYTEQLDVNPIGYPPDNSITASFNGTQGDFAWDPVSGAAFYRLEIYDIDFNRLYTFETTENAYQVPAGFLKQNTFYRYRVTTRREFFDQGVDNGSSSSYGSLMKTFMITPEQGTSTPSIELDEFGAYVMQTRKAGTSDPEFWLGFEIMVSDPDGVPDNISTVQVTYPDETTTRNLTLDSSVEPGSTQGLYSFYEIHDTTQDIQPGEYTFTLTDADGNNATPVNDTLVIDPLPIPANYTPAHGSIVGSTTPVISWDTVPDATRYRVRIYQGWDDQIHEIEDLTTNSYTVPADILEPDTIYSYRINAYKEIEGEDIDNMSMTPLFSSERPYFTADTDGSISGTVTNADNQPVSGLTLQIYDGACWDNHLTDVVTDASGSYVADGLPQGDVYIRACSDCNHKPYQNIWWDGAEGISDALCSMASPVNVVPGQETAGVDFKMTQGQRRAVWYEIAVGNGRLGAGFGLLNNFKPYLTKAELIFPNGDTYTYNLADDYFDMRTECSGSDGWYHNFDGSIVYGEYTINLSFQDGVTKTYTKEIRDVPLPPRIDSSTMTADVQDNGDIIFSWEKQGSNNYYQVRIYDSVDTSKRYYVNGFAEDINQLTVSADQLDCLNKGESYLMQVRIYDEPDWNLYQAMSSSDKVSFAYSPGVQTFQNRVKWFDVYDWRGAFSYGFSVRSGSMENITSAIVTRPDNATYTFDLTEDWYDNSSETYTGKGWWASDGQAVEGKYTLEVIFDDGYSETRSFDWALPAVTVTPVDSGTMNQQVFQDGSIDFSWDTTGLDPQLKHQIIVHSVDDTKRFYKSRSETDRQNITVYQYDLRGLEFGKTYIWYVRTYSPSYATAKYSQPKQFVYDPFEIGSPVTGSFPIQGSVMNYITAESTSTYLDIYIGTGDFDGQLINSVESISITGPDNLSLSKDDLDYWFDSYWKGGGFNTYLQGSPTEGEYSFSVQYTNGDVFQSTDIQGEARQIPVPSLIAPGSGESVNTLTPTFSWEAVSVPGTTIYYRLQIQDAQRNTIFAGNRQEGMLEYKLNSDILEPGKDYFWRVRATDSGDFVDVNNRAQTDYIPFTISSDTDVDADGDGVIDTEDQCPGTSVDTNVYENGCSIVKGDINLDKKVDLKDSMLGLKVMTGLSNSASNQADVDGDGKTGYEEAIYPLMQAVP